jgi:hypothetical protein
MSDDNPDSTPDILPLPSRPDRDWVGLAIEILDINRIPPGVRDSAAVLVRDWQRRRGIVWPRASQTQDEPDQPGDYDS